MDTTYEIFMLNRELKQITLEYHSAPSKLKPMILKDIILFKNAIELLRSA